MIYPDGFVTKRVYVIKAKPMNYMAFSPIAYAIVTKVLKP